ncbi:myb-like protein X [Trifolium pratense]|uniref:myb-like protein X n=1 Tax=Trifolium pratense TaxID=57577 RepID=UPI001E68FE1C|nr:myb-like protein X [Trifolium pratense]
MLNDKPNNFFNKKLKEKWVPKPEEKEKQLEEEEEEKPRSFLLLMEEKQQQEKKMKKKKEKVYSSLPSNYVTLAQLQERWLKQKQQQNEEKGKKEDHHPLEQRHVEVMAPTNATVSRLNILQRNLRGKREESADNRRGIDVKSEDDRKSMIGPGIADNVRVSRSSPVERNSSGNRDGPENNRRVIGVESEERRKSPTGAVIADNVTVSRLNPVERNRGGNRDGSENSRRGINVESEDGRKSVIGDGIGDGKGEVDSEVEESKTKKKKKKKKNNGWQRKKNRAKEEEEEKRAIEEGSTAAKGNEDAEKTDMKIESKEVKKLNSETVEEEVEQKFRVLSFNSENGKQNLKLKKMNYGFPDSQSPKNNRNGAGCRARRGHGNLKELQSSNMVWVKKNDDNVGEIET